MKGEYLHTERCCSYYVKCEILEWNVDEPLELQYIIDRMFNKPLRTNGAIIEFVDEFDEECTIWTTLDRVRKLP
jgi:hypothetical protein